MSNTTNASNIKNEAKIKNPIIVAIREQLEHRALWMYLLCDEAKKKGLNSEEYAPEAIHRCGIYQGGNLRQKAGGGESLKGLKKTLFSKFAQWIFEMDIKQCDDDHLYIDFHYCPLVKAWQKQGCSDEEISVLCDHAMCGDRGIAESFGARLELPATIARGDDVCKIRFVR
ncbi:MAG: L-2-amino-thiazoline-4-carboxylic acid hydrolase [Mogibacterium sp.]|nr:L-2-amino-thiazoline-4-carboxylic acid hydrolase [Mogibacterium sp.]